MVAPPSVTLHYFRTVSADRVLLYAQQLTIRNSQKLA
jgi:hypothetical protein